MEEELGDGAGSAMLGLVGHEGEILLNGNRFGMALRIGRNRHFNISNLADAAYEVGSVTISLRVRNKAVADTT